MRIPLAKLWAVNFRGLTQTAINHKERCLEYAQRPTPIPPIMLYRDDQIFDGHHRVVAASFRGDIGIDAADFRLLTPSDIPP